MLVVERQERVLAIVKQRRAAQLDDLARELDVSPSTIRRDLETLEERGLVARTHGGAIYRGQGETASQDEALAQRMNEQVMQKEAIGRYAASLVQPQMTLLLDGGSTVVYAARQIMARPIQVVTNSLPIANLFADDEKVELLVVGGNLYPRTGVTLGPIATGCLADLHADLLLFSVAGVYGDGIYNQNLTMVQVEQVMMQQAVKSVLMMDSSKFGRKSLTRVCGLDEVDLVVTDTGVGPEWQGQIGDRLIVAE